MWEVERSAKICARVVLKLQERRLRNTANCIKTYIIVHFSNMVGDVLCIFLCIWQMHCSCNEYLLA